jgi:hypothetical protein
MSDPVATSQAAPSEPFAASRSSTEPPSSAPPFTLLRLIQQDSGARFALCELLNVTHLAVMHQLCTVWRSVLDSNTYNSDQFREFTCKTALFLPRCTWVRRYVSCVKLRFEFEPKHQLSSAIKALATLPRLQSFTLSLETHRQSYCINVLFEQVTLFPQLNYLEVCGAFCDSVDINQLRLDVFPSLLNLQSFIFLPSEEWTDLQRPPSNPMSWHATTLRQCKNLTHLDFCSWGDFLGGYQMTQTRRVTRCPFIC